MIRLQEDVSAPKKQNFSRDIEDIRKEIDEFYDIMAGFSPFDPSNIFQKLAGFTARASYLRTQIMRMPENRGVTSFRTRELDPFIEECDRQFKVWSRHASITEMEFKMAGGL